MIPTEAKLQIFMERVNERGLWAVFCNWKLSYNNLLKRANLTTLYNKHLQDIAIFMFKVIHKLLPENILDLFSGTPSNYYLRNSDFYIPRFNSVRHGKHSLKFFGPRLWSKLSPGDRERQTLTAFMANIRKRDLASLVENDLCNDNCPMCSC